MHVLRLPPEIEAVFDEFRTCEFTTVNKQGQPLTWPTMPFFHKEEGRIVLTASIAFPVKVYNVKRYPKVSLLFSDPTGSKLDDPPAVLVQGDASIEELTGDPPWSYEMLKTNVSRQPDSRQYLANPVARYLFMFYYQRIGIYIQPRRILSWPHRDFSKSPTEIEVAHVE
jgi:general stress protein 26